MRLAAFCLIALTVSKSWAQTPHYSLQGSGQTDCVSGQAVFWTAAGGLGCQTLPIPPQKSETFTATNGFSHTVTDGVTIELISAANLLASGTLVLPANPSDGMPLSILSPKGVTLLTITPNSGQAFIAGYSPTGILAGDVPIRMKWAGPPVSSWVPN